MVAVQAGVEDAITKSSEEVTFHLIREQGTAEQIASSMQKVCMAECPPTAMVVTRARQVLTAISWLASRQMSVPKDMSLMALTYDNLFEALVPPVAYYHLNVSIMARGLVRKLDAVLDGREQDEKLLIPDFVLGKSVRRLEEDDA